MSNYAVRIVNEKKFLIVKEGCRKIFTSGGKLVKLDSYGMAEFDKDAIISVNRSNGWEKHNIRMVKNRQVLRDNAIITEKELSGSMAEMIEEEILLASLEVLETL